VADLVAATTCASTTHAAIGRASAQATQHSQAQVGGKQRALRQDPRLPSPPTTGWWRWCSLGCWCPSRMATKSGSTSTSPSCLAPCARLNSCVGAAAGQQRSKRVTVGSAGDGTPPPPTHTHTHKHTHTPHPTPHTPCTHIPGTSWGRLPVQAWLRPRMLPQHRCLAAANPPGTWPAPP
jgi:hypothetical protein